MNEIRVLLVHGLFGHPITLWLLGSYLKKKGFKVSSFGYPKYPSMDDVGKKFQEKVKKWKPDIIIGHSLGGCILTQNLKELDSSVKTVICLGSPLQGSSIAKFLTRTPFRLLLSEAVKKLLLNEIPVQETKIRFGIIVGTKRNTIFGLPLFFLRGGHDGVVRVNETHVKHSHHRIEMDVDHMDFMWSPKVFKQLSHFIAHGRFSVI